MDILAKLSSCLWSVPSVLALVVCGVYLSFKTRFVQLRRFPDALAGASRRLFSRPEGGGPSSFEAICTALAGTVGTGNIAGVALAISMGGPGAIFWMWISALLGMATKYAEIALAVKYREARGGEYSGGPMYYIKNGLGRRFYPMAVLFAAFGALASFGLGNVLQMGSILTLTRSGPLPPMAVGAAMAALVFLTCRGGAEGRGRVAALIVPFMAWLYVLACLGVIITGAGALPGALSSIFAGAFHGRAALGGAAGSALSWGFRRGLLSSEAGLGSSPIAHASASTGDPARQGLMGIVEVFVDTVVICTLTALAILCSGVAVSPGVPAGAELVGAALGSVYGPRVSNVFLTVSMGLFAFSSIVGWSLYGEKCLEFLTGSASGRPYRAAFAAVTLLSPLISFPQAVALSDTATFFMLISNLAALCLLAHRGAVDLS